jgi:hypothetical protein
MRKILLMILILVVIVNCTSKKNNETTDKACINNNNALNKENNENINVIKIPTDTLSFIDLVFLEWLLSPGSNYNEILKYCLSSEIRILRNEIYAKKGYIFKDIFLNSFFRKKPWYSPQFNSIESINLSNEEKKMIDSLIFYENLNRNLTIDSIHKRVNQQIISSKLKNEFVLHFIIKRFVDDYYVQTANKILYYDTLDFNYYHFVFNTWDGSNSSYNEGGNENLFLCVLNENLFPVDVETITAFYGTFEKIENNKYSFIDWKGNKKTKIFYEIDKNGNINFK